MSFSLGWIVKIFMQLKDPTIVKFHILALENLQWVPENFDRTTIWFLVYGKLYNAKNV